MAQKLTEKKKRKPSRIFAVGLFFCALSLILIYRIYRLQIVEGASYRENFTLRTTRTRSIKSTRGNIYDRNGILLASSDLSYSLTIEDNGTYGTNREKALSLNEECIRIAKLLEKHGSQISFPFHIEVGEDGEYAFTTTGWNLMRFRADVYGESYIEDLEPKEAEATADEIMAYLASEERYAVIRENRPYTDKEYEAHPHLPKTLTKEELLSIVRIRYALSTTSYQKYVPVTIAQDLGSELVAELYENKDTLTGIEIVEDSRRVYADPEYFAPIIGYTGPVSSEDLAELQQISSEYNHSSIVGKSGIEKVMETTLQGSDGAETVYVDYLGTVLAIDEDSRRDPVAGNDVYLTIDHDLQIATYRLLEQRIAGILATVIIDAKEFSEEVSDTEKIRIPSYEVYHALINNGIIDFHRFTSPEATDVELAVAQEFAEKQAEVFTALSEQLVGSAPAAYQDLPQEMQEYESYIVKDLLMDKTGILNSAAIDRADPVYLAWSRDENISMQEFLTYAASQNWVDISDIAPEESYIDSAQIYQALSAYIEEYLSGDDAFSKLLYKHLIMQDRVSGKQIMRILYEQGVLDKNDGVYEQFDSGAMSTFDTLKEKILNLDITPAMLALDPCSGSVVITNPKNGEILACVTYPGYDNNRLSNNMDTAYYRKLAADLSRPFYNKATQARTAPGSTYKLITTTAGISEGIIDSHSEYVCDGVFDLTETPLRCWNTYGHGTLSLIPAIAQSCNVYFCNVAYELGINEEGNWSDSLSLQNQQSYAELFDMDKPSGIEIPEAEPQVSDQFAIQSAIGQGTHAYTTTQIARYVTTLANSGTSYNLSLLDRVTDSKGTLIRDYTPEILSRLSLPNTTWDAVHEGMREVVLSKKDYEDMPIEVAGKTGTAQESKSRPSHALFVCYAPYTDPEIAMAVRIGNGYSSTNCILTAKDILQYRYELLPEEELLTGRAMTQNVSSEQVD